MAGGPVDVLWSRCLHLRSQAMAVSAGSIVVAERHSRLVRLDPVSGAPRWDQRVEDCWGTTVIAGDRCLYLSQAGVLHCFDLGTGRRLWFTPGLELRHHVTVSGGVVFLGGWRGYRPLIRVSLTSGERLPIDEAALVGIGPSAWPLPLRLRPKQNGDDHAVLVAGAGRPVLLVVAASGAVVAAWPLPEPIRFPDADAGYGVSADGRATFLSGTRTVMAFDPVRGVQALWRHARDIRAFPPLLDDQTLWLVDNAGITVVDLDRELVTEVETRQHGAVVAVTRTAGRAWLAFLDGSLVAVDRSGNHRIAPRILPRIDRLFAGEDGLIHAIGKGQLATFRP